ncbi:MAG: hypothetical protein CR986_07070 [Ignavibacteriae bacterium]|nr:MAG: hypothetical protein CR986_07070 [Ignavibacteriota bacterium]
MIELSSNINDYIKSNFGDEFLSNYKKFIESKYPGYIRISEDNHFAIIESLKKQGIELEKIEAIPNTYKILKGENLIGKTLEHTLGKYYIQSLSSMIPPLVLQPTENDIVLDLCAAPGSKSTQLAEMMKFQGTLYSNEPNFNRVKALIHNLDKMNAVNMWVLKEKGELLSKVFYEYFDKVLVDAPCSALGVLQKKQEVSNWWNAKSVDKISSLQLKLLISAIKAAKVGAEIVYSTCTLTIEENEFIIDKVLQKYPVILEEFELDLPYQNGLTKKADYNFDESLWLTKRIIPWELKSEGFFVAKLKKIEGTEKPKTTRVNHQNSRKIVSVNNKLIKKYILEISEYFGIDKELFNNYKFIVSNKDINFINSDSTEFYPNFFLRIGTKFGIIDKNNSLKLHSHAAQILGKFAQKNVIELESEEELKNYFAGGIIHRNFLEKGQKIVKYNNYYLGTAIASEKQLKSRFPRSKRTGKIELSSL